MSTSHYDPNFNPAYEPDEPVGAEAKLEEFRDALDKARKQLRDERDKEVKAKQARDAARRRAQLCDECPKVGVFDGVRTTVAFQQAWIEDQIVEEEDAYQQAKVARQAAGDHLHTLGKQGGFQQSITASVREAYRGTNSRWGS